MSARNRWFEERRSLRVRELLKEFHETYNRFLALYDRYIGSGLVAFEEIERLVGSESRKGHLWRLKDSCHRLWREVDPREELNGCLLDWMMGSLFHEAMKLKENAYVYQFYRPLAEKMTVSQKPQDSRDIGRESNKLHNVTCRQSGFLPDRQKMTVPGSGELLICGMEHKRFMKRTAREICKQMENLSLMFGRANYLLRLMMAEQAHNLILLRYLIENENVVIQLWSESLTELFGDLFSGAPEEGFCAAARSYMADQWQERALATYEQALAIRPDCEEARRRVLQLKALAEKELLAD
ncbi:MAG: hypothetical protein P8Y63_06735 [Deltaproteobacteria bacterium]|jgi:hypothetical protein